MRPLVLAAFRADEIVADLDHGMHQPACETMHVQGMKHAVLRPIGLVEARIDIGKALDETRRQRAVAVMQDAEFNASGLALVDRREAVDRHDDGTDATGRAPVEEGRNAVVKGPVDFSNARQPVFRRKLCVAGNGGKLADLRNGIRRLGRPVAVICQPGITLQHQRCIDEARQKARYFLGPDVPCDVAVNFAFGQAQHSKLFWQHLRAMFADEHEGRAACLIHGYQWALFAVEEQCSHNVDSPGNGRV